MKILPTRLFSINFSKYSQLTSILSSLLVGVSIYLIIFKGIDTSIDFKGGTIINVSTDTKIINLSSLRETLSQDLDQPVGVVEVESSTSKKDLILSMEYLANEQILNSSLTKIYNNYSIDKIESIGPKIGDELKINARNAIVAAFLLIGLYVTIRFDSYYALGSLVALIHDVLITLGIFIIMNIEISIAIIAAFLTIVGYSLNDTIVIYDRIRENMLQNPHRDKKQIVDESLNQTLSRTIVTSLTTMIVVSILYIYGGDVLKPFSFALIIGVFIGTYSSLFVASPIMLLLENKFNIEIEES